jgi:hypothetical protein
MHKILIVGGIILVIVIVILLTNKKTKLTFKARMDELDTCHDTCFEQYPFAWNVRKRQRCLDDCIKIDENENDNNNEDYNEQRCIDEQCGTIDKCDLFVDAEERMRCEIEYNNCLQMCKK